MADTIAAIATGAQVAAIGIIRISGPEALPIVDRLFRPASGKLMSEYEDRKLVYGRLTDLSGDLLDLCLCTVSHAPHSYTGEDTAELQCHGSPTVLRAALEELFHAGARQALPGEFTKRAFLNGRMELSSAEAVADIIDAESIECAKNAAAQLSGAVAVKADNIYSTLTDISSHYHAVLDYPDEDIEDFRLAAKAALSNLLLPFPCKPTSLGFAWSAQGAFCPFRLDGRQPVCVSKNKNHTKIHRCQVQAVLPEQKSVQAMKSPQAILCVLARALKQHGRFSARQNRVCPCQLMVQKRQIYRLR